MIICLRVGSRSWRLPILVHNTYIDQLKIVKTLDLKFIRTSKCKLCVLICDICLPPLTPSTFRNYFSRPTFFLFGNDTQYVTPKLNIFFFLNWVIFNCFISANNEYYYINYVFRYHFKWWVLRKHFCINSRRKAKYLLKFFALFLNTFVASVWNIVKF